MCNIYSILSILSYMCLNSQEMRNNNISGNYAFVMSSQRQTVKIRKLS